MKKISILFLILTLLVGCNREDKKHYEERLKLYETYWKLLLNEEKFQSDSRTFDINVEMVKNGSLYEYYVIIDNAKVAMYDIEVMVVENEEPFSQDDKMLPSAGIFEGSYTFVPNQYREDSAFRKGIILSRVELTEDEVSLRVLVNWKNYTKLESFKEVFEFDVSFAEMVEEEETEDQQ